MGFEDSVRSAIMEIAGVKEFTAEEDILKTGKLDSFALLQLITALESRFRIRFSEDDLNASNFRSLSKITALVESKVEAK